MQIFFININNNKISFSVEYFTLLNQPDPKIGYLVALFISKNSSFLAENFAHNKKHTSYRTGECLRNKNINTAYKNFSNIYIYNPKQIY